MWLKNLFLSNFRNFASLDLDFSPHLNLLGGNNGQGKTNFLEALYCLGHGVSFRTTRDEELIKWGENGLYLKGEGVRSERVFSYEFLLDRKSSKMRKVNSHQVNLRDPNQWLWMVTFFPEDLWLIKGSPSQRRNFLDSKLPFFNLRYPHWQSLYQRVLSQRNYLLSLARKREKIDHDLDTWDKQLIDLGSRIVKLRLEGLKRLESFFKKIYPRLMGRDAQVNLAYKSSFLKSVHLEVGINRIRDDFYRELRLKKKEEIERKVTMVGPHRDDFLVLIDGVDLRPFGSQGEQRIAALSLKLAELVLVRSREEDYPITLLDDVASELDPQRQRLLLSLVQNQSQVFITTAHPSLFELNFLKDAYFYQVRENQIRRKD